MQTASKSASRRCTYTMTARPPLVRRRPERSRSNSVSPSSSSSRPIFRLSVAAFRPSMCDACAKLPASAAAARYRKSTRFMRQGRRTRPQADTTSDHSQRRQLRQKNSLPMSDALVLFRPQLNTLNTRSPGRHQPFPDAGQLERSPRPSGQANWPEGEGVNDVNRSGPMGVSSGHSSETSGRPADCRMD